MYPGVDANLIRLYSQKVDKNAVIYFFPHDSAGSIIYFLC